MSIQRMLVYFSVNFIHRKPSPFGPLPMVRRITGNGRRVADYEQYALPSRRVYVPQ